MDAKDLRTETGLYERSKDGTSSKYTHSGIVLPCNSTKNYQDVSSNTLAKGDTPSSRPCAVIGPDRVVPPTTNNDGYLKKTHYEPWQAPDPTYRHPPEYPHKLPNYQGPIRNISPRQTFQENMPRIMVPPSYNSAKLTEDANYALEKHTTLTKNKLNGPLEPKYCEVPYTVNPLSENQKNADLSVPNLSNQRNCTPVWHHGSVNIRSSRPNGAPEGYQYPEYPATAGPRALAMARPQRLSEDPNQVYADSYYHENSVRFKPYPNIKERYPQSRYEYITNYANSFHPPPPFSQHKYDSQKSAPSHPAYPQVPIKYIDNRINDPIFDGYQRPAQQINYNLPYRGQIVHPAYAPVIANGMQNKLYSYPHEVPKTLASHKQPYETKLFLDYEKARNKGYPIPENYYVNEMVRPNIKSQVLIPNYQNVNMQQIPPHHYYRKDSQIPKNYEYMSHYRHFDAPNNHFMRLTSQISPNTIAISPSDSNTSNETALTQGASLEDCGYVSQSSTTSVRSMDPGAHRFMSNDVHRRHNYPYPPMFRMSPFHTRPFEKEFNENNNIAVKEKKSLDVRQFLQMWNEGDDESGGNKQNAVHPEYSDSNKPSNQYEVVKNQEQLYVLGLENVPSEELGKYEHIQKVSKLPDNIKGYNNIELLKQFEEAIESSNLNNYKSKNIQTPMKTSVQHNVGLLSRPLSPLDVEAKISQSVIHKEVGCNFEIKPCSPEMLNVEVATPLQNIIGERIIEKVTNPLNIKSPVGICLPDNGMSNNSILLKKQDHAIVVDENVKIASCKMINTQCSNSDDMNALKTNYSFQDLESSSGVCLASLPRLDNDIELNFPEVNQQFINANKVESVIIKKDLQSATDTIPNNIDLGDEIKEVSLCTEVMSNTDLEKEFSKLSKYRKIKKSDSENNHTNANSQCVRTDSVIIKNPENSKGFENALEHISSVNITVEDKQQNSENSKDLENVLEHTSSANIAVEHIQQNSENSKGLENVSEHNSSVKIAVEDKRQNSLNLNSDCFRLENTHIYQNDNTITKTENEQAIDFSFKSENNCPVTEFVDKCPNEPTNSLNSQNLSNEDTIIKSGDNMERNLFDISDSKTSIQKDEDGTQSQNKQLNNNDYSNELKQINKETSNSIIISQNVSSNDNLTVCKTETTNSLSYKSEKYQHFPDKTNSDSCRNIVQNDVSHNFQKFTDLYKCNDSDIAITIETDKQLPNCNTDSELESEIHPLHNSTISSSKIECIEMIVSDVTHLKNNNNFESINDVNSHHNVHQLKEMSSNKNIHELANVNSRDGSEHILDSAYNCGVLNAKTKADQNCLYDIQHNQKLCEESITSEKISELIIQDDSVENIIELKKKKKTDQEALHKETDQDFQLNNKDCSLNVILEDAQASCYKSDLDQENKLCSNDNFKNMLYHNTNESSGKFVLLNKVSEQNLKEISSNKDNLYQKDFKTRKQETTNEIFGNLTIISKQDLDLTTETVCRNINKENEILNNSENLTTTTADESSEVEKHNQSLTITAHSNKNLKLKKIPCNATNISTNYLIVTNQSYNDCNLLHNRENEISNELKIATEVPNLDNQNSNKQIISSTDFDVIKTERIFNEEPSCKDYQHYSCDLMCNNFIQIENAVVSSTVDPKLNDNSVYISENDSDTINKIVPTRSCNLRKELLSPRFQNLITFNEGPLICTFSFNLCEHNIQYNGVKTETVTEVKVSLLEDQLSQSEIVYANKKEESASRMIPKVDTMNINTSINNELSESEKVLDDLQNYDNDVDMSIIENQLKEMESNQTEYEHKNEFNYDIVNKDKKLEVISDQSLFKYRPPLKRSFSDSALERLGLETSENITQAQEHSSSSWRRKRRKIDGFVNVCDPHFIQENISNVHNRRNSVSSLLYDDENVSFCIVIDDNCIITEGNEEEKICYTEISDECLTEINVSIEENTETSTEIVVCPQEADCEYPETFILEMSDDKSFEETWIDDVACVETVVSDDIAEDITLSAPSSPHELGEIEDNVSDIFDSGSKHTEKVKYIYGDSLCNDDADLVDTLYKTPQMNVNKTLTNRESHSTNGYGENTTTFNIQNELLASELEHISEPTASYELDNMQQQVKIIDARFCEKSRPEKLSNTSILNEENRTEKSDSGVLSKTTVGNQEKKTQDATIHSCESSVDDVFSYNKDDSLSYNSSSSPEVSSTTSEEKSSSILLKITNYKGMITSHLNENSVSNNKLNSSKSCKFTESVSYSNFANATRHRPLVTKAAQKYIPPLKEHTMDLKVKLPLPQQSLLKLKQLKNTRNVIKPKKPKPRFEDVLKNIDEIQIKMHKEKKKPKKVVPKVVIKKSGNGSHYASTSEENTFNPDLTGRKWQPWVFLEKNIFIDKMALRNKTKAIFNYRKNTYVFADKFQKYKSTSKFMISQPKLDNPSVGNLKYTIRLKHNY